MARKPSKHVGTLGDITFHGHTLTLYCERCRHRSEVDLHALVLAYGESYLLRQVVDRAICTKCGDRDAAVTCKVGMVHPPFSPGYEPTYFNLPKKDG